MLFYKVKPEYDNMAGAELLDKYGNEHCYVMTAYELLTEKEMEKYGFPKFATDRVEINLRETIWDKDHIHRYELSYYIEQMNHIYEVLSHCGHERKILIATGSSKNSCKVAVA